MRKRRAIVIEDDPLLLDILKQFFEWRGYEVIACGKAEYCPMYDGQKACDLMRPCADILITDHRLPGMTGLEMLQQQVKMGCRILMQNKAVISGYLDSEVVAVLDAMGCVHFGKPFTFADLGKWLDECEQRMDLTMPLGFRRKELRQSCNAEVVLQSEKIDCRAEAVNRSDSGLCVKIWHYLKVGQILDLLTDMPLVSRRLQVRWTRPANDGGYFTGMSCC